MPEKWKSSPPPAEGVGSVVARAVECPAGTRGCGIRGPGTSVAALHKVAVATGRRYACLRSCHTDHHHRGAAGGVLVASDGILPGHGATVRRLVRELPDADS